MMLKGGVSLVLNAKVIYSSWNSSLTWPMVPKMDKHQASLWQVYVLLRHHVRFEELCPGNWYRPSHWVIWDADKDSQAYRIISTLRYGRTQCSYVKIEYSWKQRLVWFSCLTITFFKIYCSHWFPKFELWTTWTKTLKPVEHGGRFHLRLWCFTEHRRNGPRDTVTDHLGMKVTTYPMVSHGM